MAKDLDNQILVKHRLADLGVGICTKQRMKDEYRDGSSWRAQYYISWTHGKNGWYNMSTVDLIC